jgi:hypothetical protein
MVVEVTEQSMQLRADAPDARTAWDLRCYIRENLIKFLQERYPDSLPRVRAELRGITEPNTNGDRAPSPKNQLPARGIAPQEYPLTPLLHFCTFTFRPEEEWP